MTTDQTAATAQQGQAAQSVNGQAPPGAELPGLPDTGERWLGILVIAAGCFLLLVGIDRVSGGRITGALHAGE
jgi:uncharacterized protein (DUF2235 family)